MQPVSLDQQLKTLGILVLAMMMGMLVFAGVSFFLHNSGRLEAKADMQVLLIPFFGLLAAEAVAMVVLRNVLTGIAKKLHAKAETEERREHVIRGSFATMTILFPAMIEGLALFGIVIHLLTGLHWMLAVAPVAAVAMLAFFPTRGRYASFARRFGADDWTADPFTGDSESI